MYGTQDAADKWEASSSASSCHYVHADGSIQTVSHGDDFIGTGTPGQIERLKAVLESDYEIKYKFCGPGEVLTAARKSLGGSLPLRKMVSVMKPTPATLRRPSKHVGWTTVSLLAILGRHGPMETRSI